MRRTALTILLAACLLAAAARADDALRRPGLTEGQRMVYDLAAEVVTGHPGEEDRLEQRARIELVVRSAGDGGAVVAARVAGVSVKTSDGVDVSVSFADDGAFVVTPETAPREHADPLRVLMASELRLVVSPEGEVVRVEGLGNALTVAGRAGEDGAAIAGLFFPEQLAAALSPVFGADFGGAAQRVAGESWETQRTAALGRSRELRQTNSWKLDAVDGAAASLRATVRVSIERAEGESAAAAVGSVREQRGGVECVWDTHAGQLDRRTRTLAMQIAWRVEDLEVVHGHDSTLTLVRVAGAPELPALEALPRTEPALPRSGRLQPGG